MGWSAWALDNIWWVAGGSLAISFLLHFVVVWLFKNSGKTQSEQAEKSAKQNADNSVDKE